MINVPVMKTGFKLLLRTSTIAVLRIAFDPRGDHSP